MFVTSCRIDAFGQLRDEDYNGLDQSIVVVLGPNEAGKSTLFHFLESMLYGIYPTDATRHAYAPRDGRALEGSAVVRTDDGRVYTVARRLMSSPQGQLTGPGGTSDLRNQTLPFLLHISQDVFDAVYALTLYDLSALSDEKAWQPIQDRLLGSLSIDYIRPAREVIEELEDEASRLWRGDRRGKPASRALQERMRDLRGQARNAQEWDRQARGLADRIAALVAEEQLLKEERVEIEARKRKFERLRPLRDCLIKMEEAELQAGDPTELEGIPDDPCERLHDLSSAVEAGDRKLDEIDSQIDAAQRTVDGLSDRDLLVLDASAEIRAWAKKVESHLARVVRLEETERRISATETKLDERAAHLLTRPWNPEGAGKIAAVSQAELRQRIGAFEAAQAAVDEAVVRRAARSESTAAETIVTPGALAASAAFVLLAAVVAVVALNEYALAAVMVAITLVLAGWAHTLRQRNARRQRLESSDPVASLERERTERRRRVAELLDGIPLPEGRLERPDPYLANDLATVQETLGMLEELQETARALGVAVELERRRAQQLLERVNETRDRHADVALIASRLEEALTKAEERSRQVELARRELDRLNAERRSVAGERVRVAQEKAHLEEALRRLGGDIESGIEVHLNRLKALRRLESLREDLEHAFPHHERLKAEIDEEAMSEGWEPSDREMTEADQRLSEIIEQLHANAKALAEARKDLERIQERPTLAAVQSEIGQLQTELEDLGTRHDQLRLLASVVREAEQRFKREHQPDVLRRAGDYLRRITGGRYDRIDYEEGTDTLRVFESGHAFGFEVAAPLSQGTRDQIYLAFRLAIVDHLDEGQERLPVFLDEVFVNWDRIRRCRFYSVLDDVARRRQLFVFTCHPWLVEEIRTHLPTALIDLERELAYDRPVTPRVPILETS